MSTMEPRVWHYVKPNEQTRVPRSVCVIRTEANRARVAGGHEQTWRVGVAWFRKARKNRPAHEATVVARTPGELWQTVTDHCGRSGRTVLWAHNLGYDARIGCAFTELPALGWDLVAHNVAPRGTWLVWRRERATLVMVDATSVWPHTVATIGQWFGMGRLDEPGPDAEPADWVAHAQADAAIIARAVTTYLDWVERADMGNWQFTGAGMAWSAYRHRFMRHQLLVHCDEDALAMERRAMWTGRCEAYWHGSIGYQEVQEWDFATAYARVARDANVPVQLIGPLPPHRLEWLHSPSDDVAVLAEVTVTTDTPTVPTLHDGRILWPVGTFTTTLWDVEIRAAIADGATVSVHRGFLYRAAPALHDWAQWVIAGVEAPEAECPLWLKAILKHWSRALVGRFAMQYATWESWGIMPTMGAERRTMLDDIEGTTYETMHVGSDLWRESGMVEWAQSMPAITGYIMAACRVRLWRVIQSMPPGSVLYVDTDSLIIVDSWKPQILHIAQTGPGDGLRLKSTYRGFSILGPRQIVTGERVRMAGVPIMAARVGRQDFAGSVTESLDVAMRSGRPAVVRTSDRRWHVAGADHRRSGPGVGWTAPYRLDTAGVAS